MEADGLDNPKPASQEGCGDMGCPPPGTYDFINPACSLDTENVGDKV